MAEFSLPLNRTVFLPAGSPGIGSLLRVSGDLREVRCGSAGGEVYCIGEADILVEYLSCSGSGGLFSSRPPTDQSAGGSEWQALLSLPFQLCVSGDLPPEAAYRVNLGRLEWTMVAARALELEAEVIISYQATASDEAERELTSSIANDLDAGTETDEDRRELTSSIAIDRGEAAEQPPAGEPPAGEPGYILRPPGMARKNRKRGGIGLMTKWREESLVPDSRITEDNATVSGAADMGTEAAPEAALTPVEIVSLVAEAPEEEVQAAIRQAMAQAEQVVRECRQVWEGPAATGAARELSVATEADPGGYSISMVFPQLNAKMESAPAAETAKAVAETAAENSQPGPQPEARPEPQLSSEGIAEAKPSPEPVAPVEQELQPENLLAGQTAELATGEPAAPEAAEIAVAAEEAEEAESEALIIDILETEESELVTITEPAAVVATPVSKEAAPPPVPTAASPAPVKAGAAVTDPAAEAAAEAAEIAAKRAARRRFRPNLHVEAHNNDIDLTAFKINIKL